MLCLRFKLCAFMVEKYAWSCKIILVSAYIYMCVCFCLYLNVFIVSMFTHQSIHNEPRL